MEKNKLISWHILKVVSFFEKCATTVWAPQFDAWIINQDDDDDDDNDDDGDSVDDGGSDDDDDDDGTVAWPLKAETIGVPTTYRD